MAGKTCVVTGANSGIGLEVARALARGGARVVLACRSRSKAANAAKDIISSTGNVNVECRALDLANLASVREFAEGFNGPEEVVDILVNNAGGQFISAAEQITPKGFRAVMRLNLDATWYLTTQAASLSMLANGYGKVACITMTPSRGMPGMTHSSASRAAVESLVRTWAAEWASRGVRTVAVAPGIVHTEAMERYGIDPAQVATVVPAGRLQTPQEVAELVAFCAAPAGDYITGTTLVADGGLNVSAPSPLQA